VHTFEDLVHSKRKSVMPESLFPRRYYIDHEGRRVLIGLTVEQTREFERLELPDPSSDMQIGTSMNSNPAQLDHGRWLELYLQHQEAWEIWRAGGSETNLSRVTAGQSFEQSRADLKRLSFET
jgi:hypothetical protein